MSSYNSIEKIKYTDNLSDAVSLDEYIVFGDERREEKYIVFKFFNNVNQKLLGMKFEVSQYDMHDNLIEKSVVIYNNFLAKPNSSFVPKAKLKAMYACKRISVKLVQAAFDRVLWNEGEYIDNTYKFEHYARDEKYIDEVERPKQEPPAPQKKKESRDDRERFRSKDITKKNVAVFPKVFFWITSILLVIAIGVTVWLFPKYSKKFTLSGYDLELMADNNVRIYGYEGDEDALVVPKEIEGYQVVTIGSGAFQYLSVQSITLPDTVTTIESGAFRNLKNLKRVKCASESVTVQSWAFRDITSLTVFDMVGARLEKNCFYGCSNLSEVTFAQTDVAKFVDLFGTETHTVKTTPNGKYKGEQEEFFEGVKFR
ncbi:MAG: leucine-rich repeat domain-containing protein [Clostridia bacterium]|nr:leucine-rich repeat domain-containing protein [Clostridia bacterium]